MKTDLEAAKRDTSIAGVEDRQVKLGCVMPGESPAVFGDALRRLAGAATYLYQDGNRYWYDTQPTVTKLAEDRAAQLTREADKVAEEIEARIREDLKRPGDFSRVHPLPRTSQDVPDDRDARLVVLGPDHPYSKDEGSAAELAAKNILSSRGNTPRLYQNTLVFLAPDKTRLQELDEAVRRYLAWESIVAETDALDLSPHQVKQAESRLSAADATVKARLPETYQWLLAPTQATPQASIEWQATRLLGQDSLAARASRKLRNDELLLTGFAGTRLRMELDRVPLWRREGTDVSIRQLADDFARYVYLPRLRDSVVLAAAVADGLKLLTWQVDTFAFADAYDEDGGRYVGLRGGEILSFVDVDGQGLLVRADVAQRQLEVETRPPAGASADETGGAPRVGSGDGDSGGAATGGNEGAGETSGGAADPSGIPVTPAAPMPKRFHGAATLDTYRVGRDAGRVADEVIAHLSGLVGAEVTITLEIEAHVPSGVPENVVRIVTENSRTLKFSSQEFERE